MSVNMMAASLRCSVLSLIRISSFEFRHSERSDASFQLVVSQSHLVQECIPTRVRVKILEERIGLEAGQARVALPMRPLQPLKCPVLLSSIGIDFCDLIGCPVGIVVN